MNTFFKFVLLLTMVTVMIVGDSVMAITVMRNGTIRFTGLRSC